MQVAKQVDVKLDDIKVTVINPVDINTKYPRGIQLQMGVSTGYG